MVCQHDLLLGNRQHLLRKGLFLTIKAVTLPCNQDASLSYLSFLTFGEQLVLPEMLCQALQMLL
jgi:hypothetical protein